MKIFNGQQYKTISIIGSFKKQMDDIQRAKKVFLNKGFKVLAPASTTISGEKNISFVLLDSDNPNKSPRELENDYVKALLDSDVVYCCNRDGYIGGTAMFELGYLIAMGQEVYFQERPKEELICSLITNKYNICSPERLCEILLGENELWNSREWFDKDHKYIPDFSFEKEQY